MFTKTDILSQLEAMRAPRGSVVIIHSSLRSVGALDGGAEALLDALIEYFTAEGGLLCIPTHTWGNADMEITLDMESAENDLGVLSTVAINDGRGVRTENPTHSMVIFGDAERATAFASLDLNIDSPISPEGCYGQIYRDDGYILLVGVGQNKNTFIHTVEEMLDTPHRMTEEKRRFTVRYPGGDVKESYMRWFDESVYGDVSLRFGKFEIPLRYHGVIVDGFVGNAPTQLCSAKKIMEVLRPIYNNIDGCDPLADESMIPPRWYCNKS